jgi:hypothetical protein
MDIKKLLKDNPWELTPEEFDAQFQFKRSLRPRLFNEVFTEWTIRERYDEINKLDFDEKVDLVLGLDDDDE